MNPQTWAGLSDGLVVMALAGYVVAMVTHAADLVVRLRQRAPATALATVAVQDRPYAVARWAAPMAVAVTAIAALLHAAGVLARGLAAGRLPLGNLYEFMLAAGLAGAVAWLVILARRPVRDLGLFVTLALTVLLGVAGRFHVRAEPVVPALASPWLRIHVGAAALATGLLLVGFVATALHLLRLRHDAALVAGRLPAPGGTIGKLPDPETLDRLALRTHQVAFPIWTFAIVAGAIWAEAAWGRYWGWDPKEVWAFISWLLYACYLHARSTAGWRGRPAALIAMVAWGTMLVNLFVVNLAFSGLHSYAGL